MSTQKRCHYEVLKLPQTCTQEEIRSSYKKLALQRHPDKLIQSGISAQDATSSFQELKHSYEVLSDPKERSWYDSHRSQILFSSSNDVSSNSSSPFPDLFSYFSPSCYTDYNDSETGFYRVYSDVFDRVYSEEIGFCRKMGLNVGLVKEAPLFGGLGCDYTQVSAFYGYWLSFSTVMDFGWVVKWNASAGVDRKSRRVMEDENKKLSKKARREYNELVRKLVEFVKKRDKRVIDMMVVKARERERKREEEMAKKKEKEREKMERAKRFEEPEWSRVEVVEEEEEEEEEKKEFYCVACGKKFKSDKQWRNHEQSKKHKDKVAELRRSFIEEDDEGEGDRDVDDEDKNDGFVSAEEDGVEDLEEKFRDFVEVDKGKSKEVELHSDDEDEMTDAEEFIEVHKSVGSDDELSVLEAMMSGRRNRKEVTVETHTNHVESEEEVEHEDEVKPEEEVEPMDKVEPEEEVEPMEYNNKKGKKKSRRAKKEKGKNFEAETSKAYDNDTNVPGEENNEPDGSDGGDQENYDTQNSTRTRKQSVERKNDSKRDVDTKSKNSSRGRKQKEKSKNYEPMCEKCGKEFESRSKLHKHLSETGHASLKSR